MPGSESSADAQRGRVGESIAELAAIDFDAFDLPGVLTRIAELARNVLVIDGQVSVTLIHGERPSTVALTGEPALTLDQVQYRTGSGPCVDAAATSETLMVRDIATETRWPEFAAAAVEHGILSSLSLNFPLQTATTGALNMYSPAADAFDVPTVELGLTFADFAAVAIANAERYDSATAQAGQMRQAMEHRSVIDQAIGALMAQRRCGHDEAFEILRSLSNATNTKLREVAAPWVAQLTGPTGPAP